MADPQIKVKLEDGKEFTVNVARQLMELVVGQRDAYAREEYEDDAGNEYMEEIFQPGVMQFVVEDVDENGPEGWELSAEIFNALYDKVNVSVNFNQ